MITAGGKLVRKIVVILSVLFFILLVACNDENSVPEENTSDDVEQENKDSEEDTKNEEDEDEKDLDEEVPESEENSEVVEPKYKIDENASVVPVEDGVNENVVLLTIDDAPDKYSLEMAKKLKELEAGAIFFVNGHFIDTEEEQETLKQIHEMGFVIGNHTYNHPLLSDLEGKDDQQREEIVGLNNVIEEIIGERPAFFRAPNGVNTDYSRQLALEEEMVLMNWTYGYDYFKPYMDAEKLTTAMVTGEGPEVDVPYSLLKPGANLLMHDREWTNDALEEIVTGLREQGYEIVDPHLIQTISEKESVE
ncbi:polysaccharide deacetylase family protein [Ornithinibacillus sp. L9]|uniref:Polysaccharide deacetylase family protein n=1 Tax=Ornithinibacillus caprae TaxID=2678566 RepID=A0A6N8FK60_9BACI|nr:polysaccharide deacetylase family protein [Ornithinibacillus caprae]